MVAIPVIDNVDWNLAASTAAGLMEPEIVLGMATVMYYCRAEQLGLMHSADYPGPHGPDRPPAAKEAAEQAVGMLAETAAQQAETVYLEGYSRSVYCRLGLAHLDHLVVVL